MGQLEHIFTHGDLYVAAGAIAFLTLALAVASAVFRRRRASRPVLTLCLLVILAGAAGGVWFSPHPDDAVITAGEPVTLRVSPISTADPVGSLAPGDRLRLEGRHGAFVYVRARDGTTGWADADAVTPFLQGR